MLAGVAGGILLKRTSENNKNIVDCAIIGLSTSKGKVGIFRFTVQDCNGRNCILFFENSQHKAVMIWKLLGALHFLTLEIYLPILVIILSCYFLLSNYTHVFLFVKVSYFHPTLPVIFKLSELITMQ